MPNVDTTSEYDDDLYDDDDLYGDDDEQDDDGDYDDAGDDQAADDYDDDDYDDDEYDSDEYDYDDDVTDEDDDEDDDGTDYDYYDDYDDEDEQDSDADTADDDLPDDDGDDYDTDDYEDDEDTDPEGEGDTDVDLDGWPVDDPDLTDEDGDGDVDAKDLIIRKLRKENAAARVRNREIQDSAVAAAEETIGSMLGTIATRIGYDGDLDPDGIADHYDQARADAASARSELAVVKAATALGADVDRLLDSNSFTQRINSLDPMEKAYPDAVSAEVRRFMDSHPEAKRNSQAPRSSGDLSNAKPTMPTEEMTVEQLAKRRRERRQ